jgi:hypothetical protein
MNGAQDFFKKALGHTKIFHCVSNFRFVANCQINRCHIDITLL